MDCRDFLRLAAACRDGSSRYACALLEWHRRNCPRCAAAVATARRANAPRRERAPLVRTA
jgi:hypothetical protein